MRKPMPNPWKEWIERAQDLGFTEAPTLKPTGAGGALAPTLTSVRSDLGDCQRCGLCEGRQNIVFGEGSPEAELMIIGEGPGAHEDRQGRPFVGAAGDLLTAMVEKGLGVPREAVYITNVVKCRPPKNRDPHPDEVAACSPFLEAQIRAIQPRALLLMGAVALRCLVPGPGGIRKRRGQWVEVLGIPALPTYHPSYLLRQPEEKRAAWQDLQALIVHMGWSR